MTDLKIPRELLRSHSAILGKTGSGKSSTARLFVERAAREGLRVCILDPIKSDWWGIISSSDGKRPGLPFHILGGPHGHVPLHENAGKAIGEIVASGALPLSIIDMADFKAGGLQHFFCDFAEALFKKMKGTVILVVEEAHEFAPKERSGIGAENMTVYWMKKVATGSRTKGIRLIVATQRTQALHNAVLGSCENLIAHRFISPADQEPIVKWLKSNVKDKARVTEIEQSLSVLQTGEAWVCSGELGILNKMKFPRITTYDNSATPEDDADHIEVKSAAVDQEKLRAIIGDAMKEAENNDPKALWKRIHELEAQVKKAPAMVERIVVDEKAIKNANFEGYTKGEQTGYVTGYKTGWKHLADKMGDALNSASRGLDDVLATLSLNPGDIEMALPSTIPHSGKFMPGVKFSYPKPQPVIPKPMPPVERAGINGPQQKILDSLAWWRSAGTERPTRIQVAVVARYSPQGGAFQNPLGALRTMGLVDYPSTGTVTLTDAGSAAANHPDTPTGTAELHRRLQGILNGPQWKILGPIIEAYPNQLTRKEVAEAAGYEPSGGAFQNPLGSLRSLGLIEYPGTGLVVASQSLFIV